MQWIGFQKGQVIIIIIVDVLLIVYAFVLLRLYNQHVVLGRRQVLMHIMLTGHFMEYLGDMFMLVIVDHLHHHLMILPVVYQLKEELWEYKLT